MRTLRGALLLLVVFCAARAAVAQELKCPTNVEVTPPDLRGDVKLNVTLSGCGGGILQRVKVETPDGPVTFIDVPCAVNQTCTIPLNTICWPPGSSYAITVESDCAIQTPQGCTNHKNTVTSSVSGASVAPPVLSGSWDASRTEAVFQYDLAHGVAIAVDDGPEEPNCVGKKDYPGTCRKGVPPDCSVPHKIKARAWRCDGDLRVEVTAVVDVPTKECVAEATQCDDCKPACDTPSICVGQPVNVGSGDVSATVDLFSIAEPAEPLRMALTYRTTPPRFGIPYKPLGNRWTHTFNQSVTKIGLYRLQWYTDTGERAFFDRSAPGHWYAAKPGTLHERIELQGSEYVILHRDGSKSAFDAASGLWLRRSDRWGNTVAGEYTNGRLSAVVDPLGRRIAFTYVGDTLSAITLENGANWRFEYDDGFLARIYDPLHTGTKEWRRMVYSNDRHLYNIVDDAGAIIEGHHHNVFGQGTLNFKQGFQDEYEIVYPAGSDQRIVRRKIDDTLKQESTYTVAFIKGEFYATRVQGGCPGCGTTASSADFTYDDRGHLLTKTDANGHVTGYTYDVNGNVLSRTEAKGTAKERQFLFTYAHPAWPDFQTGASVPGGLGRSETTRSWNANETVLTETRTGRLSADSPAITSYVTVTTFDSRHRVLSIDGPRTDVNDVVTYTYHSDNDPIKELRGRLKTVTNGAGHVTTYQDYDLFGLAREIVDPNGVITDLDTDDRGRITSTTNRGIAADPGENASYTTSVTYDSRDRISETVSARGFKTQYVHQPGTNRILEIILLNGNQQQVERRRYTYTDGGERETETDQSCAVPALACTSWETKRSVAFTYDGLNRLKEIVHPIPAGASVLHGYDAEGRLASIRDERHAQPNTFYEYDEHERLKRVQQVLSTATGGFAVTEYAYDPADNLVSVKDPNGNVTSYLYDDFGRMVKQTSPVTGITTYGYDPAGNLLTTSDANGATTTRTYDVLNRVRTAVSSKSGAATETIEWTYDAGAYGLGRLRTMTDPTGSATYHHDRRGLLKLEEKTILGVAFVTGFRHDADGNRTEITYPSGTKVTYGYDFAGRPFSATAGSTPLVESAAYYPFGPLREIQFGNATRQTMLYDSRYRVDENLLTGPAGPIAHYDYASDAAGNITAIADLRDEGFSRTFAYDDLSRLTAASTGAALWGTGSYTYDAMGNLTTYALGNWRSGTLTYPDTTPQVAGIVCDAAGNETIEASRTRKYSPRNQMSALDDNRDAAGVTRHVGYGYDGRGVRVWREQGYIGDTRPHAVRRYVYGPELQLLMTTQDSRPIGFAKSFHSPLQIQSEYVWFGSRPLATLTPDGARQTYFTDHLGTPLIQTDATGTVAWRAEYEPYGNIALMRTGKASDQPLRLPGQEYEGTYNGTEESYNVFRWYRAGWGRYTQSDPLGVLGTLRLRQHPAMSPTAVAAGAEDLRQLLFTLRGDFFNQAPATPGGAYLYAEGDPVGSIDPYGLERIFCTVFRESAKPEPSPFGGNICRFTGICQGASGKMYKYDKSDPWTYRFVPPCQECPMACVFIYETINRNYYPSNYPLCYGKVPVDNSRGFTPGGGRFRGKGGSGGW